MNTQVRKYIEQNSNLLDNRNFQEFFDNCPSDIRSDISAMLLGADIDPLPEMSDIPDLMYYYLDIESIDIPPNIQTIGSGAFSICYFLRDVTLHEGLLSIGNGAFNDTTALKNISLPQSLTQLGARCFNHSRLTEIRIPKNVKSIPYKCFYMCTQLEEAFFEEGVTVLGPEAFRECTHLKYVTIPKSTRRISSYCFEGCALGSVLYMGSKEDWEKKVLLENRVFGDKELVITCADGGEKILYLPE